MWLAVSTESHAQTDTLRRRPSTSPDSLQALPAPLRTAEEALSLFEDEWEEIATEASGYNWEEELSELDDLLQSPLDLNRAGRAALQRFTFLADRQIAGLLAYLRLHGPMQTVYELSLVEEMDRATIARLLPFVTVRPVEETHRAPSLKTLLKQGRHEAMARLDIPLYTRQGYATGHYLGNPFYHSLRYRFHAGDRLQAGLTAEKDAGEPFFALHDKRGYDYYSPYLLLRDMGRLKTLALGNYRLGYGMGLVVNMGFHLGKSYALTQFRGGGIGKHSSTDEYNYLQGAAVAVEILPRLQLAAFYSRRAMDGTVKGDTAVTSIMQTGLHRTAGEAGKRHAFTLQAAGAHLAYEGNRFQAGLTALAYCFSLPYQPRLTSYARYNLHGSHFYNLGMDYRWLAGHFTWSGEAAMGKQGFALVNLVDYRPVTGLQLRLLHRYYAHNYRAFYARSFGEGSRVQNENGWYMAVEAAPLARLGLFASLDLVSFPWWRYRVSKPSRTVDAMLQSTYTPRRHLTLQLSYRFKRSERDVTGTSGGVILPTYRHRLRWRLQCTPGAWLLRATADYTRFIQSKASQGGQLTGMAAYTFPFRLSLTCQATLFATGDYDSRVYVSERGLLYTFSTPSYSGTGARLSAVARYEPLKWLMLQLKAGLTRYTGRDATGSGDDLIPSPRKVDLQLQGRVKF
ncbi:MAG: helix-hairpin-helix domain-containing protein [Prevotellaceae bacterium]|nr:helix-hairpin-helix domain-containing protein [Prevotellaceae bacterium]